MDREWIEKSLGLIRNDHTMTTKLLVIGNSPKEPKMILKKDRIESDDNGRNFLGTIIPSSKQRKRAQK